MSLSIRNSIAAIVALLMIGVPVHAETQAPDNPKLTAPARTGISLTQRKLALAEAVQLALENNLEIDIEKTNRDSSLQSVEAARGFFDPTFRWAPLIEDRNTPAGSILQGAGG